MVGPKHIGKEVDISQVLVSKKILVSAICIRYHYKIFPEENGMTQTPSSVTVYSYKPMNHNIISRSPVFLI